jgi:hypothetical protein
MPIAGPVDVPVMMRTRRARFKSQRRTWELEQHCAPYPENTPERRPQNDNTSFDPQDRAPLSGRVRAAAVLVFLEDSPTQHSSPKFKISKLKS